MNELCETIKNAPALILYSEINTVEHLLCILRFVLVSLRILNSSCIISRKIYTMYTHLLVDACTIIYCVNKIRKVYTLFTTIFGWRNKHPCVTGNKFRHNVIYVKSHLKQTYSRNELVKMTFQSRCIIWQIFYVVPKYSATGFVFL